MAIQIERKLNISDFLCDTIIPSSCHGSVSLESGGSYRNIKGQRFEKVHCNFCGIVSILEWISKGLLSIDCKFSRNTDLLLSLWNHSQRKTRKSEVFTRFLSFCTQKNIRVVIVIHFDIALQYSKIAHPN